ncbi:hypothetical protein P9139_05395 [Curtobacterium flaccumfaciens]|nr:hypothetical protein P9139_05395 [Curtobacterium flaccumfaciens]
MPDFHNPTQGTLPAVGRERLVALAERYDFVVFADNPYRELLVRRRPRTRRRLQPLRARRARQHVHEDARPRAPAGVDRRAGALRWRRRRAPEPAGLAQLDVRAGRHRRARDRGRDPVRPHPRPCSCAVPRPCGDPRLGTGRRGPRRLRGDRPGGGLFLWPRIADDRIDADALAAAASAEGVEYQRGGFFPSGPGTDADRHLRLAYGHVDEERLRLAATRLGQAVARS